MRLQRKQRADEPRHSKHLRRRGRRLRREKREQVTGDAQRAVRPEHFGGGGDVGGERWAELSQAREDERTLAEASCRGAHAGRQRWNAQQAAEQ